MDAGTILMLLLGCLIVLNLMGISASLHRLATHHERFPAPEPEPTLLTALDVEAIQDAHKLRAEQ